MTTNSFGGALPPFDFPKPEAPALSKYARVSRFFPLMAIGATAVGIAYYNYTTGRKSHSSGVSYPSMHFQPIQSLSQRQGMGRLDARAGGPPRPSS